MVPKGVLEIVGHLDMVMPDQIVSFLGSEAVVDLICGNRCTIVITASGLVCTCCGYDFVTQEKNPRLKVQIH